MPKLWFKDGKLYVDDAGRPYYTDTAPCCPVCPWPPASWPSGGYQQTYHLDYREEPSWYDDVACTGSVIRTGVTVLSVDLTAVNAKACTWEGTGTLDIRHYVGGVECRTETRNVTARLRFCGQWVVEIIGWSSAIIAGGPTGTTSNSDCAEDANDYCSVTSVSVYVPESWTIS